MMTLNELKARVNVGETDNDTLQVRLDDATDFVCGYLNRTFDENDIEMPARVKRIIAKYVSAELAFAGTEGVKSESLAGMSQTFESRDERDNALKAELRATGLRKLRW